MRNLALILMYEGTRYHGWQVQKTEITVAQTLEEAAEQVVGHPVHMTGCGRTDAGVHAKVYVANFQHPFDHSCRTVALCAQYAPAAGCGGDACI